jgi:hypothetical protein
VLSVVCDASENRASRQVRHAISDPPDLGRDDRRISERDCQFVESLDAVHVGPVPATVPALGPSKLVNMKPWDLIMLIGVIVGPSDPDR